MSKKQPGYEELRHDLDSKMLQASGLRTEPERQGFVNRMFLSIHQAHQGKQVNHDEYVKLINRLAAYQGGKFNDYLDILAGAAQLGMLEMAIQGEVSELTPEAARERSQTITGMTGAAPVKPLDTHEK